LKKEPIFAVLGSGNAGTSLAGYLALSNYSVKFGELPSFEESIKPMQKKGGIDVQGEYGTGFAKPDLITTDIKKAVEDVDVIMVCCPAYGHEAFTRACAPYLEDGQIVVYISYFAALRMNKVLSEIKCKADVTLAETLSFIFACDRIGPTTALIKRQKEGLPVAAFPAKRTNIVLKMLNTVFPSMTCAANVLETSINNINPIGHPPGVVLNAGWIEATQGGFSFYMEGMTAAVEKLQKAIDKEKMEVAGALGLKKISDEELTSMFYRKIIMETGSTHQPKYYAKVKDAPKSLNHRYLTEDLNYGLVPLSSIGKEFGVKTPTIDALIKIASIIAERDFLKEGVTVEKLGIKGLSINELNKYVNEGKL
jgi:opine dehydrogenase